MKLKLAGCLVLAIIAAIDYPLSVASGGWWLLGPCGIILGSIAFGLAGATIQVETRKRNVRHRQAKKGSLDTQAIQKAGDIAYAAWTSPLASFPHATYTGTSLTEQPELERVESDMPILAHRAAGLTVMPTSAPFMTVSGKGSFGVDTEAHCAAQRYYDVKYGSDRSRKDRHKAPGVNCECGLYALPTDLAPTYEGPSYVTLMVELSGTVIECERGYRAEHQRVIECQIPPCAYCGRQADLIVVNKFQMEQATCAAHKPVDEPGKVYVAVDDLRLPVPVTRLGRSRERHD